ncbi:hypothetical protein [Aporhodopirellula aestuarii]|uniref:Uncharacterized protein n=1 Tax=Aporhodopirellula aestuarii TaxID=2950107 RepID=A0ABT0UDR1_9BACT|nr:hypothetical protein [Aporhodopirellula aestuarii]MCM2374426.1 hypothetical protein [Aporhodopirellula aestuarii]
MDNEARNHDLDDRYSLTENLRRCDSHDALSGWQADTPVTEDSHAPAYHLAVAMGRCLLFDFLPSDERLMTPLYPSMLEAALIGANRVASTTLDWLRSLDEDMQGCETPIEQHELAIRVLQRRFDLHAATLVVDQCIRIETDGANELPVTLTSYRDIVDFALSRLDKEIERERDWLSTADQTYWVENLATDLSSQSWPLEDRPWWLGPEIAGLRRELQDIDERFALAGDSQIAVASVVQNLVAPNHGERQDQHASDSTFSLAADADREKPNQQLQSYLHKFSDEESIEIVFEVAAIDGAPEQLHAETEILVSVEFHTVGEFLTIDSEGVAKRAFVLRWGLYSISVEVKRRVTADAHGVSLLGTSRIPWAAYRPLFEGKEPTIHIRRVG